MIAKLLKYEIYRRKKILTAWGILLLVAEALILFGLYKGEEWLVLSTFMVFLVIGGTFLYVLIDTIYSYFSDLKNKHGYMLFLTPNSGYKIIASKALIGFIELVLSVLLLFGLMYLNFIVAKNIYYHPESNQAFSVIEQMTMAFKGLIPSIWQIIQFVLVGLLQWFNIIMMAIFAITLSKTIFSNSRHSFLISLLIFILLSITIQTISMAALAPFGLFGDMINMPAGQDVTAASLQISKYVTVGMVLYVIYISVFYWLSGMFLNKRIDL